MGSEEVEVVRTGGGLPEFWDRSALFFANLLALFFGNEEETRRLAEEVGEVDSYGGRLIPVLNLIFRGSENVLVLERAPDEELCQYFERTLGMSLPRREILSHRDYLALGEQLRGGGNGGGELLAKFRRSGAQWVDGYVTDENLCLIAGELGKKTVTTEVGSRRGNNKLLLFEFLRAEGLPCVETEMAAGLEEVPGALARLAKRGFGAAVLKSQIGASGIGLVKVPDTSTPRLGEIEEHLFFEGPCLVQGWIEKGEQGVREILSPSVQMFVAEERVSLYDITEQILSHESVHEGNVSPPPYLAADAGVRDELLRQAEVAGRWLHAQGYRGTASTDFLLVYRDGSALPEVYVCEINARVTGATYPSVMARHFRPEGAWLMRNLRVAEPLEGARLLEMLEWPGHLYHRGRDFGVLPVNFNFGSDGLVHKGQFLCLGDTPEECHECLRAAQSDLPVEWAFDRD